MAVGRESLIDLLPVGGMAEQSGSGAPVEAVLTLADFDADIGKGAAADRSGGTAYGDADELIAGLSRLAACSTP